MGQVIEHEVREEIDYLWQFFWNVSVHMNNMDILNQDLNSESLG